MLHINVDLLQSERNRKIILHTHSGTILLTWIPFRHLTYHAHGLPIQRRVNRTSNLHICNRAITLYHERDYYASLHAILHSDYRILDSTIQVFHQSTVSTREGRHNLYNVEDLILYLLLRSGRRSSNSNVITNRDVSTISGTLTVLRTYGNLLVQLIHLLHFVLLLYQFIFLDNGSSKLLCSADFLNDLLGLDLRFNLLLLFSLFLSQILQPLKLHCFHVSLLSLSILLFDNLPCEEASNESSGYE